MNNFAPLGLLPNSLGESLAALINRCLKPQAVALLVPYAGHYWELELAGNRFIFVILDNGTIMSLPKESEATITAGISIRVTNLIAMLFDADAAKQARLYGQADMLQVLGQVFSPDNFSLERVVSLPTTMKDSAIALALAQKVIEYVLQHFKNTSKALAEQGLYYARDERAFLVHRARSNQHNDNLLKLSHRIERLNVVIKKYRNHK